MNMSMYLDPFLTQHLVLWPAPSELGPGNELQSIAAILKTFGHLGDDKALAALNTRLERLTSDRTTESFNSASLPAPNCLQLQQARQAGTPLTVAKLTEAALADWKAEGLSAPENETQSLERWIARLACQGTRDAKIVLRVRMTLLMKAASALHAAGPEAEAEAGVYAMRPEAAPKLTPAP